MAAPLVECVPNFSEGRDAATIEALRTALTSVPGVRLLDVQADASHNRSVFTLVAPPEAALQPALRAMPRAGPSAVGARPFLVAFNIYLDTPDVAVAKEIAKRSRASSGGLPAVQASGFEVAGRAQVSMNLLDIDTTPPAAVYAAVEAEARTRGVAVMKSEVVGLVPERAILGAGAAALRPARPPHPLVDARNPAP